MKQRTLQGIFIQILFFELTEGMPDEAFKKQLTPEVILSLYELSKSHDLAHIVSGALYKYGVMTEKTASQFNKEEMLSLYRYERMKATYCEITDILEGKKIIYIPLKGSVIRPYYPKESMRTSCDIDILVHEEDLEAATDALVKKGYLFEERHYHDISLYSPSRVHLELHFSILENKDNIDTVLKDVWSYAVPDENCRYKFTDPFFVFHFFAHIYYHFLSGGCGIRSLMDVWIIAHRMGLNYIVAKELLEKAGILRFAEGINDLAESCFSGREWDKRSEVLLHYIMNGGVYGTVRNRIAGKKRHNGTLIYLFKRVFMPYSSMVTVFPILKKAPVLLPFFWIVRVFRMLFGGKIGRSVMELKMACGVTDEEIDLMAYMREQLGM